MKTIQKKIFLTDKKSGKKILISSQEKRLSKSNNSIKSNFYLRSYRNSQTIENYVR